jgi:pimeloyl-ACP methyl ester carboxylesterase
MVLVFSVVIVIIGWSLFSTTAGIVVYISSLRTRAEMSKNGKKSRLETNPVFEAHTKDMRIMGPLNAAKERWNVFKETRIFEDVSVITKNKIRLVGWYWKAEKTYAEKTVILVHGIMDTGAGLGYLGEEYHRRNWNVLYIDLRCHGNSDGKTTTMGVKESRDIGLWVDYVAEKYKAGEVYLHGVSMGGATVLLYAGTAVNLPENIKGIISDSSFARYNEAFFSLVYLVIRNKFLAWSITKGASAGSLLLTGVSFGRMNPERVINRISVPVLLFHGEEDVLVSIQSVRKMFAKILKPDNEVVIVNGAPHIGAYFYAPSLYMEKIESLSRKH